MADVRAFVGLRYAEPLERVVAPPYDVLDEEQVAAYRATSPHNVVHLTRPGQDYEGAGRLLERWLAEGVLVEEAQPAMYLHRTEFVTPPRPGRTGGPRTRLDLLTILRLVPYEEGVVLPHERTHRGPREDRLALLRATRACLEPIWLLAEGLRPLLEEAPGGEERRFAFAGERHTLRRLTDAGWLEAVRTALARSPLLIADGHHRYETSLAYAREVETRDHRAGLEDRGSGAAGFTLALITDLADPGLVVLPTHRLLRAGIAVTGGEEVGSLEELLRALEGRPAAGTYREGKFQLLPLEGDLAVVELHHQVIDNLLGRRDPEDYLAYTRDAEEAVRWVDSGRGVAAFFLGAPDLAAVLKAAREGKTMPQKSTYFHPKPPSGMVLYRFDRSQGSTV
ncbi:MAG TPA: DUF1015 domain-containing protein [Candidatus Dormibacteraeota bacterium]|nr:DUF1015 domain-containing protein [Candidatus Dormibacteraeota bacterium]